VFRQSVGLGSRAGQRLNADGGHPWAELAVVSGRMLSRLEGLVPGGAQILGQPRDFASGLSKERGIDSDGLQFGVVTHAHLAGELPGFAIAPVPQLAPGHPESHLLPRRSDCRPDCGLPQYEFWLRTDRFQGVGEPQASISTQLLQNVSIPFQIELF
jgi:hypothetical protein